MTTQSRRKKVVAVVQGFSKRTDGKPQVIFHVPEWDCKVYADLTSEAQQDELPEKETLRVHLDVGAIKKDKDDDGQYTVERDRTNPANYFYKYTGLDGDQDIPEPEVKAAVASAEKPDARQSSIERQVAYKEAIAMVTARHDVKELVGFWDIVNAATNVGESILNRTYVNSTAKMIEADESEAPKEKDDDHLF